MWLEFISHTNKGRGSLRRSRMKNWIAKITKWKNWFTAGSNMSNSKIFSLYVPHFLYFPVSPFPSPMSVLLLSLPFSSWRASFLQIFIDSSLSLSLRTKNTLDWDFSQVRYPLKWLMISCHFLHITHMSLSALQDLKCYILPWFLSFPFQGEGMDRVSLCVSGCSGVC